MTHVYRDKSEAFHRELREALMRLPQEKHSVALFDESYPASLSRRAVVSYIDTPYGKRWRVSRQSGDVSSSGSYYEPEEFEALYAAILKLFEQLEAASKRRWDLLSRVKRAGVDDTFSHVARLGFEIVEG